jgi:hypothetical protein
LNSQQWFQLGNPLAGSVFGSTTVNEAAVFTRSIEVAPDTRDVSDGLVTALLNLATGLGNSTKSRNNVSMPCGGKERRLWYCLVDAVAAVVVDDLRHRVVPVRGVADPVVVLMVQEARPMLVDAIAARMSSQFGRAVSTLFVTQDPDASVCNAEGGTCDDGDPPQHYRCEYGNALLATVSLAPLVGVNFTHPPENRMFIAAAISVGGCAITVGTYHAQIDVANRRGQQAEERSVLERVAAALPDPVIVGGDYNDVRFGLDGFTKHGLLPRVDAFLSRGALQSARLGTCRARKLRSAPYELDHKRVAMKWRIPT